jgi:putative transposase
MIDYSGLRDTLGFRSFQDLVASYRKWIEASLEKDNIRDAKWTESIAVGTESFVRSTKTILGIKAKGRKVVGGHGSCSLRESASPYRGNLTGENAAVKPQNEYFWKDVIGISIR